MVIVSLTPEQQVVVEAPRFQGCTAVVAVAGSGKTRVLVERARWLVHEGVPAERIGFVTFSRAAAAELKARLTQSASGARLSACRASTLHALALRHFSSDARLMRGAEEEELWREAYKYTIELVPGLWDYWGSGGQESFERFQKDARQSRQQLCLGGIQAAWDQIPDVQPAPLELQVAYQFYEEQRRVAGQFSFDDLLIDALSRLQTDDPAAATLQERFDVLIVDEYQDVSVLQAALIRALATGKEFMAVGDPQQCIYEFQSASPAVFEHLLTHPDTRTFRLTDNHRSPGQHLLAASAALGRRGPALIPARGFDGSLDVTWLERPKDANRLLANRVETLLAGGEEQVIVLARSKKLVAQARQALVHLKPRPAAGASRLHEVSEEGLELIIALQRLLTSDRSGDHPLLTFLDLSMHDPELAPEARFWLREAGRDHLTLSGILARRRPAGLEWLLTLWQELTAAAPKNSLALIRLVLQHVHGRLPEEYLDDLRMAREAHLPLPKLWDEARRLLQWHREASLVQVMTIHAAKGREWPCVVLFEPKDSRADWPDDVWSPPDHAQLDEDHHHAEITEEDRLRYVALTRSTHTLHAVLSSECAPAFRRAFSFPTLDRIRCAHRILTGHPDVWQPGDVQRLVQWMSVGQSSLRPYLERHWTNHAGAEALAVARGILEAAEVTVPSSWSVGPVKPLRPKPRRMPLIFVDGEND